MADASTWADEHRRAILAGLSIPAPQPMPQPGCSQFAPVLGPVQDPGVTLSALQRAALAYLARQ
jgi:hypothetical protein